MIYAKHRHVKNMFPLNHRRQTNKHLFACLNHNALSPLFFMSFSFLIMSPNLNKTCGFNFFSICKYINLFVVSSPNSSNALKVHLFVFSFRSKIIKSLSISYCQKLKFYVECSYYLICLFESSKGASQSVQSYMKIYTWPCSPVVLEANHRTSRKLLANLLICPIWIFSVFFQHNKNKSKSEIFHSQHEAILSKIGKWQSLRAVVTFVSEMRTVTSADLNSLKNSQNIWSAKDHLL